MTTLERWWRVSAVGLVLLLGEAGCSTGGKAAAVEAAAVARLEPAVCGSIANVHRFGGLLLAGAPQPEDLAAARREGVTTVINLRRASEVTAFDERQVVEAAGMRYVHLPFGDAAELTDAIFDAVRAELRSADGRLLLHCASANRVGAVWLPFRVLDGGLSWEEALAEAKTVGLKSADYERRAREYIDARR